MTTNKKVTAEGDNSKKKSQTTIISATITKRKRNNDVYRNTGIKNVTENIDLAMHGCLPEHSLPFPV